MDNMEGASCKTELHVQVEHIYGNNQQSFEILEGHFLDRFGIPREITRDAIKQRILGALNRDLPSQWLSSPGSVWGKMGLYGAAMCYLLWCSMFGPRFQRMKAEVLFEYWSAHLSEFYDELIRKLASCNLAAFGPPFPGHSCIPIKRQYLRRHRPFSRRAAWLVFKSQWSCFRKYRKLSVHTGLDMVDLSLRLSSEIAIHLTSIENISARILVSAHDNGYSPIRYHLYRANGIDRLLLIQNGGRVGMWEHFNSYIYSDYYIGWSAHRIENFFEMHCDHRIALGSSRLNAFLRKYANTEAADQYDILFVEQIFGSSHEGSLIYRSVLEKLVRYAAENPGRKIAYCPRRKSVEYDSATSEQIVAVLSGSTIHVLDVNPPISSYDYLARSRLLVAYNSSMRCEAVVLGKMILSCSEREEPYDYVAKFSDPCLIVSRNDYKEFSGKIDFLLDNPQSEEVVAAMDKLRRAMVAPEEHDIPGEIADLVLSELECAIG